MTTAQKENEVQKEEQLDIKDAPVLTAGGLPDMRIKENREKFLVDPSLDKNGKPDLRKKENRPDLQAISENRAEDTSNVKFDPNTGEMKE